MVTAMFGADGRSDTVSAALLLALGLTLTGNPTTLIRVVGPAEGFARVPDRATRDLEIVEYYADLPDFAGMGIAEHLAAARRAGRRIVLDMPLESLSDVTLRELITLPVLLVGAAAVEERFAAQAMRERATGIHSDAAVAARVAPPWMLGCGRSGGAQAAATFEAAMRAAFCSEGIDGPVRALPITIPALSRSEAAALLRGAVTPRLLRMAILTLAAVETASLDPHADFLDRNAFAEAAGLGRTETVTMDDRVLNERLLDLADALVAIEANDGPDARDLEHAPLLDDFAVALDPGARVLTGVAHGHQNWREPREIRTSQIFASDGRSWARSLNRLYRLGRPVEGAGGHLQ